MDQCLGKHTNLRIDTFRRVFTCDEINDVSAANNFIIAFTKPFQ